MNEVYIILVVVNPGKRENDSGCGLVSSVSLLRVENPLSCQSQGEGGSERI